MLLRTSLTSPFGRKIRMASLRLGLTHRIQTVSADTTDPADEIRIDNPLGKVPLLVLDDGRRIYDSRVILECLDHMAGGGVIIPREWNDRLETLVFQSLGDGIMDAAVLVSYESRYRPEEIRSEKWLGHQTGKIERGLDHLTEEGARSGPLRRGDDLDLLHAGLSGLAQAGRLARGFPRARPLARRFPRRRARIRRHGARSRGVSAGHKRVRRD